MMGVGIQRKGQKLFNGNDKRRRQEFGILEKMRALQKRKNKEHGKKEKNEAKKEMTEKVQGFRGVVSGYT